MRIPTSGVGSFGLSPDEAVPWHSDATDVSGAESLLVMPMAGRHFSRQVFRPQCDQSAYRALGLDLRKAGRSPWPCAAETANPASCGSWMRRADARESST